MAASQQEIQAILEMAAGAYGANSKVLDSMTRRESSYRDVVNDWDSNAKAGTPSAGILQFIEPTYRSFSKEARKANPAAWKGVADNWRDPRAQALTAAWAITNGKGGHWATYKAALADAGAKSAKGQKAPSIPGAAPSPGYGLLEAPAGRSATAGLLEDGFLKSFLERRAARQPVQQVAAAPPQGLTCGQETGRTPAARERRGSSTSTECCKPSSDCSTIRATRRPRAASTPREADTARVRPRTTATPAMTRRFLRLPTTGWTQTRMRSDCRSLGTGRKTTRVTPTTSTRRPRDRSGVGDES